MKKLIFVIVCVLCFGSLVGQVEGLSSSKLIVFASDVIAPKHIEFEPAYGYLWASKSFDDAGKLKSFTPSDSTVVLQAMAFRFTYGLGKNMEVGSVIAADMSTLSFALKYNFLQRKKHGFAAFLGTTFANESDFVVRNSGFFGKTASLAGGFAYSTVFSKRFSLDADIQYQNIFTDNASFSDDIFSRVELGYTFKEDYVLVGGFSYSYNNYKNGLNDSYLLTFNAGLVGNVGRSFIFVIALPFDIVGRNNDSFNGLAFALTIMLD